MLGILWLLGSDDGDRFIARQYPCGRIDHREFVSAYIEMHSSLDKTKMELDCVYMKAEFLLINLTIYYIRFLQWIKNATGSW